MPQGQENNVGHITVTSLHLLYAVEVKFHVVILIPETTGSVGV